MIITQSVPYAFHLQAKNWRAEKWKMFKDPQIFRFLRVFSASLQNQKEKWEVFDQKQKFELEKNFQTKKEQKTSWEEEKNRFYCITVSNIYTICVKYKTYNVC